MPVLAARTAFIALSTGGAVPVCRVGEACDISQAPAVEAAPVCVLVQVAY
jgi:hypothetical protein